MREEGLAHMRASDLICEAIRSRACCTSAMEIIRAWLNLTFLAETLPNMTS